MDVIDCRQLLEGVPAGLFQCDRRGRFTYVNRQFELLCGQGNATVLAGGWAHLLPDEEWQRVNPVWQQAITRRTRFDTTLTFARHDGARVSVKVEAVPVSSARFDGFLGSMQGLGQAGPATLADEGRSDPRHSDLDSFLYLTAHDLRAPLRAIDFSAVLLGEHVQFRDGDAEHPELKHIRGRVQQTNELLDHMIHLARASYMPVRRMPVDMSALATSVCAELNTTDRPVTATIEPGLFAEGEPTLLRLALYNMFANAYKFTRPQSSPELRFGAEQRPSGTEFYINDNGIGFSEEEAGALFQPFQRLHADEYTGSGLGLATVRLIIERHGGTVRAEPGPQGGAIFRFTLA